MACRLLQPARAKKNLSKKGKPVAGLYECKLAQLKLLCPPPPTCKNEKQTVWTLGADHLIIIENQVCFSGSNNFTNTETYSVFSQVRALSAQQNQDRLHPVLDNSNSLHWWNLTFPNLLMVCLLWCKGVFILIMIIIPMELLQKYYPMKLIKMNIHTTHF